MLIRILAEAVGCLLGFAVARLITLLPLDVIDDGGTSNMIVVARPVYFLYAMAFALHWL